ncbi:MAG TPA: tRNA pseudouridine(38-40) synthase TruA [Halanaerobiales bacterium]|nr:tRNA pseudouridine(38-40) synthase TruA [Halanaerobiales bacterium]
MRNIKLVLEYDGTNYSGWQIQENTDHTIQQKFQEALEKINKAPLKVTAAGRTDAGVHALGQVVNFSLDVNIPVERIPMAINRLLPPDIVCIEAREVPLEFHARFDARGKKYRYRIYNQQIPSVFIRNYTFHYRYKLKLDIIREAMAYFKGKHDFRAFCSSGSQITDTVRTINSFVLKEKNGELWFEISGDGFLYNMIRIIIGTLLEISAGKIKLDELITILDGGDRSLAGFTAPAHGLTLLEVYY